MLVSANDIAHWAERRDSQGELPMLVRRLIGQLGHFTSLSMPAGSSVSVGGFDGELQAPIGNAFVPEGKSVWELSVEASSKSKANRDYKKRTEQVSEDIRKKTTYVAVTGRKWGKKEDWSKEKNNANEWKCVKAIDADDLELWLEQESATQIWFAELLGIPTDALKSPERYWKDWNRDVVPPISQNAVLASRESESELFIKLLQNKNCKKTIVIHADSCEEAVAFACANIIKKSDELYLKVLL